MSTNSEQPDSRPLETVDVSDVDDPRRPLIRALRFGRWALVAIAVISLAIWGGTRDLPGIWGALMGASVGGSYVLLTALSVLLTSGTSPTNTLVVVLGGWIVKIVVLIAFIFAIRNLTFYDHQAFGITTILSLIVVLGTEAWAVVTTRVTNVSS